MERFSNGTVARIVVFGRRYFVWFPIMIDVIISDKKQPVLPTIRVFQPKKVTRLPLSRFLTEWQGNLQATSISKPRVSRFKNMNQPTSSDAIHLTDERFEMQLNAPIK